MSASSPQRSSPDPSPAYGLRVGPCHPAHARGFSLVEVVVALGVVAFALVGIIGLFPVAIRTNLECQRETRATHIAQMIMADLRVNSSPHRLCLPVPSWPVTRLNLGDNGATAFLAFSEQGEGQTNAVTSAQFEAGLHEATYLVGLRVDTNTGFARLSLVEATIETPAAVPSTNRSKFRFVTLMSYQEEF